MKQTVLFSGGIDRSMASGAVLILDTTTPIPEDAAAAEAAIVAYWVNLSQQPADAPKKKSSKKKKDENAPDDPLRDLQELDYVLPDLIDRLGGVLAIFPKHSNPRIRAASQAAYEVYRKACPLPALASGLKQHFS